MRREEKEEVGRREGKREERGRGEKAKESRAAEWNQGKDLLILSKAP